MSHPMNEREEHNLRTGSRPTRTCRLRSVLRNTLAKCEALGRRAAAYDKTGQQTKGAIIRCCRSSAADVDSCIVLDFGAVVGLARVAGLAWATISLWGVDLRSVRSFEPETTVAGFLGRPKAQALSSEAQKSA